MSLHLVLFCRLPSRPSDHWLLLLYTRATCSHLPDPHFKERKAHNVCRGSGTAAYPALTITGHSHEVCMSPLPVGGHLFTRPQHYPPSHQSTHSLTKSINNAHNLAIVLDRSGKTTFFNNCLHKQLPSPLLA